MRACTHGDRDYVILRLRSKAWGLLPSIQSRQTAMAGIRGEPIRGEIDGSLITCMHACLCTSTHAFIDNWQVE